jgi:hypothetical protein
VGDFWDHVLMNELPERFLLAGYCSIAGCVVNKDVVGDDVVVCSKQCILFIELQNEAAPGVDQPAPRCSVNRAARGQDFLCVLRRSFAWNCHVDYSE